MKNIYLIVGLSGSGKTTEVDILKKKYGYTDIASYTTRPKRHPTEKGHTFVSEETFKQLKNQMCAYTYFNGHHYGATIEQINNADLYIIDLKGINELLQKIATVPDGKTSHIIYIKIPVLIRLYRLLKRDGVKNGLRRFLNDFKMFKGVNSYKFDYVCKYKRQQGDIADDIHKYIQKTEMFQRY